MDATDWIVLAAVVTVSVGTLAGLVLHGFSNVNDRIDDTNRQIAEIRADLSKSEQRTDRRVEGLEACGCKCPTAKRLANGSASCPQGSLPSLMRQRAAEFSSMTIAVASS